MAVILNFTSGRTTSFNLTEEKAKKLIDILQAKDEYFTIEGKEAIIWVNKNKLNSVIFTDEKEYQWKQ